MKSVLIPLRNPFSSDISRSGISSIRPLYSMTFIFWPGRSCRESLIFFGMTTWYFGETVTVVIMASKSIAFWYYNIIIDAILSIFGPARCIGTECFFAIPRSWMCTPLIATPVTGMSQIPVYLGPEPFGPERIDNGSEVCLEAEGLMVCPFDQAQGRRSFLYINSINGLVKPLYNTGKLF